MSKILVGLAQEGMVITEAPSVRLISKLVSFGKTNVRVFSVGHLALALHRSTATIRRWQRKSIIPVPLIKTKDGARWYLKEELEIYKRLLDAYALCTGVSIESTGFAKEVHAEIQSLKNKMQKQIINKEYK